MEVLYVKGSADGMMTLIYRKVSYFLPLAHHWYNHRTSISSYSIFRYQTYKHKIGGYYSEIGSVNRQIYFLQGLNENYFTYELLGMFLLTGQCKGH